MVTHSTTLTSLSVDIPGYDCDLQPSHGRQVQQQALGPTPRYGYGRSTRLRGDLPHVYRAGVQDLAEECP